MENDLSTWQRETQKLAAQVDDLKQRLTHERYERSVHLFAVCVIALINPVFVHSCDGNV